MYGSKAPDLVNNKAMGKQMLMLLRSNTPAGKEAQEAYLAGQSGTLGGKPSQVMSLLAGNVGLEFTPSQAPIKEIFDKAASKVAESVRTGAVPKGTETAAFDQAVKDMFNAQLKDIEPGKNMFNIGAAIDIVGKIGVMETPFAQKVLMPALAPNDDVTKGAKLDRGSDVFALAIASIKNKVVSIDEAAEGIAAFYQKGVAMNLAVRNLPKFGVVPDELMRSYNTSIELNPYAIIGGTKVTNLANPLDVKRAIGTALANQNPITPLAWFGQ